MNRRRVCVVVAILLIVGLGWWKIFAPDNTLRDMLRVFYDEVRILLLPITG
jgi:hypothetical protein